MMRLIGRKPRAYFGEKEMFRYPGKLVVSSLEDAGLKQEAYEAMGRARKASRAAVTETKDKGRSAWHIPSTWNSS